MSGIDLHLVERTIPPVVGSVPADQIQVVDHPPDSGPAPPSDRLRAVLAAVSGGMDVGEQEPAPAEPEQPGVDAIRARLALIGLPFPR